MLCRSFSELYQKAIKDAECKPGEDQSGEAWVVDEREEEEEEEEVAKEDELKADGVNEVDTVEVQVVAEDGDEQLCDNGQSEGSHGPFLSPPSLPLLRATSLQDQPANQSQEGSTSQLTRSLSLERQPSYSDTCDGWVVTITRQNQHHVYNLKKEILHKQNIYSHCLKFLCTPQ